MNKLTIGLFGAPGCLCSLAYALVVSSPAAAQAPAPSGGGACAVHIEGDYDIKRRLGEIGCQKGDTLLLYNHAQTARWQSILPVRIAAILVCDMEKPISGIGTVGSQPFQSLICTYSGSVRRFKSTAKDLKGWEGF